MADTRSPEEKRVDNLKDLISRGAKNPDTLSKGSKKLLASRGENVLQTPTGVYIIPAEAKTPPQTQTINPTDAIQTPFGTFKLGNTPFEQLDTGSGVFFEQAKFALQRIRLTEQYNPEGLNKAFSSTLEEYPEEYRKASEIAIEKRITERNVSMFQQSALGDLLTAGLITTVGEQNEVFLSEKGKNLGIENFYSLEEGAIWGKSFDFIIEDSGALLIYPQGTRKEMKEAGLDAPIFLEKDGIEYIVTQRRGKDTIMVAPVDKITNTILKPESKKFSDFLDLSGYEIGGDATFEYALADNEFNIQASGVKKIKPDSKLDFWPKSFGEGTLQPEKRPEKLSERGEEFDSGFIETPMTRFYTREDALEMAKPLRDLEKSIGATIKNPIQGVGIDEIGLISFAPYLFASGIETTIKSAASVGSLVLTGGELFVREHGFNVGGKSGFSIQPSPLTDYERRVKASELIASGPYLQIAPIVTTLSIVGFLEGKATTTSKIMKPEQARMRLLSVRMEEGVPVEEYTLMTRTMYKPGFEQMAATTKAGIRMPEISFSSFMKGGAKKVQGAYEGAKVMNLIAGSEKQVVRQLAASKSPIAAYAAITAVGLNPFSTTKPQVQRFKFKVQEQPRQDFIKPAITVSVLKEFYKANPQILKGIMPRQVIQPTARVRGMPNIFERELSPTELQRQRIIQEARMEDIYYREAGRTRYEQIQAIREMHRTGVRTRVGQYERERLYEGTQTRVGVIEIPRIGLGEQLRLGAKQRQRVKIEVRPILAFPTLAALGGEKMPSIFKQPKPQRIRTAYAPSLAGVLGGKIEKKIKKAYSGFEIRGIQRRKRKYGLF